MRQSSSCGALTCTRVSAPGALAADPMLRFVLMVESATPTAINLVVMSTLHAWRRAETSTLLFYEYIAALGTVTVSTLAFLRFLA